MEPLQVYISEMEMKAHRFGLPKTDVFSTASRRVVLGKCGRRKHVMEMDVEWTPHSVRLEYNAI